MTDTLGAAMDALHSCAHATATVRGELARGNLTTDGARAMLARIASRLRDADQAMHAAWHDLAGDVPREVA